MLIRFPLHYVRDSRDTDSDGDTIPDRLEAGEDPEHPVDTDADGTPGRGNDRARVLLFTERRLTVHLWF